MIKSVAVYAASSTKIDEKYFIAAHKLGEILAHNNIRLVYGAGNVGLMGEVATSVLLNGGNVTGVIPQFMVEQGWIKNDLKDIIITRDMHERKSTIEKLSDAMVALPGGIGTFEELLEILTWKQLGLHTKPVIILNIDGYYNELLLCLDKMIKENFMRDMHKQMYVVIDNPCDLIKALSTAPKWDKSIRKHAQI